MKIWRYSIGQGKNKDNNSEKLNLFFVIIATNFDETSMA